MPQNVDVVCDHSYESSWIHHTVERSPIVSVSTDPVPKKDRLLWWTHLAGHEIVPTSLASEHADDFHGRAFSIDMAGVRIRECVSSPMTGRRTPAHIQRHDPDGYQLFLVNNGSVGLEQRRNDTLLKAGDFSLFGTSHPFAAEFVDEGGPVRLTFMFLPRDLLPLPRAELDRLVANKLPADTGSGALLAGYLSSLREHAAGCEPGELSRLGGIGLDLAAVYLAGRLGMQRHLPPESRQRTLAARIDAFIDHHLGDPDLSPSAIAAHHHISVRTLHLLFKERPETVSATIRRRRLERCHADLADPRLREHAIGEIGVRWGFKSGAEFSRAFRTVYGLSPRDHRQQTLPPQEM
ncbi:helix-turn-helix domain-containing protein [Nonomuraea sp. NPDC050790]|uniref:AraC-like ligand-binding domain-containing protein n=1 Tax=Nonomuraea sp. NPDC050790 TaxID=3364371 RepID=UPI0037B215BA